MLDIFHTCCDFIFPPHHSVVTLRPVTPEKFLLHYAPSRIDKIQVLASYLEPTVKAAIIANKFHNHTKAAVVLGILLKHWLEEQPELPTLLVPIPLGSTRRRQRGYNQVERVLRQVSHPTSTVVPLLIRSKDTAPQTTLPRMERLINMSDVFQFVSYHFPAQHFRVVLIDDVMTTGSTLRSAQAELQKHLPEHGELHLLALAH